MRYDHALNKFTEISAELKYRSQVTGHRPQFIGCRSQVFFKKITFGGYALKPITTNRTCG